MESGLRYCSKCFGSLAISLSLMLAPMAGSAVEQDNTLASQTFLADNSADLSNSPNAVTENKSQPLMVHGGSQDQANKRIWNLHNVDLLAVINEVSKETGKNFLIDPKVKGNVTLISSHEMNADEVYQVFLSVLAVSGYAAIPSGDVIKIVPDEAAKQMNTTVASAAHPGQGDEMVVRVIPIQYVSASDLSGILRSLVDPRGQLVAYVPSNVIIVADHANNVKRIAEIIHRVDVASTDGLEVISLRNANAVDVEQALNKLIAVPTQSYAARPSIASDERSNSILLNGNKTQRLRLRAMIAQLDVPSRSGYGNTEVVFIRYQRAADLIPALASVQSAYYESKKQASARAAPGSIAGGGATGTGAASAAGGSSTVNAQPTSSSGTTVTNSGFNAAESGLGPLFADDFFNSRAGNNTNVPGITVEANTNALVITAPPELMRMLRSVIRKLDLRRPQVLVEAIIAEIERDCDLQFGIEWRTPVLQNELYVGTGFQGIAGLNPTPSILPTLQGLAMGLIRHGDLRAVLRALANDQDSNILSTPSLITLDNEKASIVVQERVPVVTGDFQQPNTNTDQPYRTYAYAAIGLRLTLLPQITKDDAIQLRIQEQTGDIVAGSETTNPGGDPTFRDRGIETSVVVNDGDVLVLGGLIQRDETDVINKVPYLGDLPVLGNFFRYRNRNNIKRNLMIFIRPIILRNRCDNFEVSKNQYDFIRDHEILREFEKYGHVREDENLPAPPWEMQRLQEVCTRLPSPFGLGSCCKVSRLGGCCDKGGCCGR